MKHIHILLSLLLCSVLSTQAQSVNLDSLRALLPGVKDTARVNVLNTLASELNLSAPDEGRKYMEEAIVLARKSEFPKGLVKAYCVKGYYFLYESEYMSAAENFKTAWQIMEASHINDASLYLTLHNALGSAYYRMGNYKEALDNFLKSLALAEKSGNKLKEYTLLNNIGLLYLDQSDHKNSLDYFLKSLKGAGEHNFTALAGLAANNIGLVYRDKNDYDKSIHYFLMSIEKKKASGNNTLGISVSLANLAEIYKRRKDYRTALLYLDEAESLKRKLNDKSGLIMVNDVRADILIAQRKLDQAEALILQNLAVVNEIGGENVPFVYQRFHDLNVAKGDYKKALYWFARKARFNDSTFTATSSRQLAELQTLYDVSKKEKAIVELEKEKKEAALARNIMLISIVSLIVIILLVVFFLRYRLKKRHQLYEIERELNLRKLENASLREEELKKEIEFKNRELASYTINFVRKSEMMEELKRNLQAIAPENPDVARKIAGINRLVENSYQVDREWEDFKMQFENVHHNFFRFLKERCPELTNGDLKLCALLKLNMNLKEAAKVLGISPESVKTARYRLRKKFALAQEDNLVDFILNMESEMESGDKIEISA
jgi:tetratricopeptide (TPR) repeat protein